MQIVLMYGTKAENHALPIVRVAAAIESTALIITDRCTESAIKGLLKAAGESESQDRMLFLTDDPHLTVHGLLALAAKFPEIVSIRWSGHWQNDVTQAFRVAACPEASSPS